MYASPSDDDDACEPTPSPPKAPPRKRKVVARGKKNMPPTRAPPPPPSYKARPLHERKGCCLKNPCEEDHDPNADARFWNTNPEQVYHVVYESFTN